MKRVRVAVAAPDSMARKIAYALEELLIAARVPHCVERAETAAGADLLYGEHPPEGDALWMAASRAAWCFFELPGTRVERVETLPVAGHWVRLPGWSAGDRSEEDNQGATVSLASALPDMAAAAFFFLARWEEWRAPHRDPFGRYPLAASVFGRGLWSLTECPVEVYARALRRALEAAPRTAWVSSLLPPPASRLPAFSLGLSHDIDSVRRWDARGFARTGRAAARALVRGKWGLAAQGAVALAGGLRARIGGPDPHQNLAEIVALEGEKGLRSTFFVLSRHTHPWDGTHPAHYQRLLPSLVRELPPAGVGVHASTAATDAAALREERTRVEELTGFPARGVRFHNLRGGYGALPAVAAAGFDYDSTLGFAEEPGFAGGFARPFRPYDRDRDRPLDLVEVPLAVMDTTLLSPRYLGLTAAAGRQRALATLESLRHWGGAAALLWHNDNLPPNTAGGYAAQYAELIEWARAAGGRVAPLADITAEWKQNRAWLQNR